MEQSPGILKISLFGQPRFARGGVPFLFSARPKVLPLLGYMLLHRDRAISRDHLAFLLWEDSAEEEARTNLRRHLHHLARALPESDIPWFETDAESVRWNERAPAIVDVAEFERLVAQPDGRAAAVDLYAGDLLENLYDEWVLGPRERLRSRYLAALTDLGHEARSARRFADTVSYAQRILRSDPWREDAVRQLMAARYESGDGAGALGAYDGFSRALRAELLVDPMPETKALRDAILRNEPVSPGGASPAADDLGRPREAPLPFVGRAIEMEQLQALWHRAAERRGVVAFIGGEAGIGKTRLVSELALLVEAEGGRVLFGATSFPENAPYQVLKGALRSGLPMVSTALSEPLWRNALAQLLPELGDAEPAVSQRTGSGGDRERTRLFEAAARALAELSRARPLLLVLEDLHWAGNATIEAVTFIVRRLRTSPIMIVATYRPEEAAGTHPLRVLRREAMADGVGASIAPRRLDATAVAQLVDGISVLADRGPDLAARLHARSDGNPLFVMHALREAIEGRDVSAVPSDLRAALRARVDRVSEPARSLAEIASVAERGFDIDTLQSVSGWSEDRVLEALDELIDRHLVREVVGRRSFEYTFTHHLVQQTIYEGTEPTTLVLRHRRMARVLEATHRDEAQAAGEIARHFELGHERATAARYYLASAKHATTLYANDEAIDLSSRALALCDDAAVRFDALMVRAAAHERRGSRTSQRADLDELERMATASGDNEALCDVLEQRIGLARALGERNAEAQFIERFGALTESSGDAKRRSAALIAAGRHAALMNRFDDARRAADGALALATDASDLPGSIEALRLLGEISAQQSAADEADRYFAAAISAARAHGDRGLLAKTIWSNASAALMSQRFARCLELSLGSVDEFRALGDQEGEADAFARCASAAVRMGRFDDALRFNERASAVFEAIGKPQGIAITHMNVGIAAGRYGLLQQAIDAFATADRIFTALDDLRGRTACALNACFAHLALGDAVAARELATRALDMSRTIGHRPYEAQALAFAGCVERDFGDGDTAIIRLRAALEMHATLDRPSDSVSDMADLAAAYLAKGDLASARAVTEEFLAAESGLIDLAIWPQYMPWTAARVFRAVGDDGRTAELLQHAQTMLETHAAAMPSDETRLAFRELPLNRAIVRAVQENLWP